ncbi:hypothetical protein JR334_10260 [Clostridia bacterium]|nr:hypothetical protein JR334_10260 [Clostridia bacterium]
MYKKIAILLAVIFIIGASGCSDKERPEKENPSSEDFFGQEQDTTPVKAVEVKDEAMLQSVWQDLLYDSITSIGNQESFASTSELSVETIAQYAFFRYQRDYGEEALELGEDQRKRIKESQILEISERYLDREELDFSKVSELDYSYLPDEKAFGYYMSIEEPTDYTENTAWGIRFDKLEQLSNGRYRATLVDYVDQEEALVETYWRYELGRREDGSWYFISGTKEHPDNHLVKIEGNYTEYTSIGGHETSGDSNFVAQLDENRALVVGQKKEENEYVSYLGVLNLKDMSMVTEIEIEVKYGVSWQDGQIIVKGTDAVVVLDDSLKQKQKIMLPIILKQAIDQGTTYDDSNNIVHFFRDYDISPDLQHFCYADEEGLKLLDAGSEEVLLLSKTLDLGYDLLPYSYYIDCHFVSGGNKILTAMSGYEELYDRYLYDLENMSGHLLKVGEYGYSAYLSEAGQLLIATSESNLMLYDLAKEEKRSLDTTEVKGAQEDISLMYADSGQFIAYATTEAETYTTYIHRIDTETDQIEANILKIEEASVNLIAVLNDGRVLAAYYRYPNEYGYILSTKEE